jgi:hypothetical protein
MSATKQRLVKTGKTICAAVTVIFGVCRSVTPSQLFLVTSSRSSIYPIKSQKPAYGHSIMWQYVKSRRRYVVGSMVNTSFNLLTHLNYTAHRLCFISIISIVIASFVSLAIATVSGLCTNSRRNSARLNRLVLSSLLVTLDAWTCHAFPEPILLYFPEYVPDLFLLIFP